MRCIIVIFNVSVFKFLFFSLYFLSVVAAENLSYQRLAWQMEGGDVRSIAGLCRQYVQKKLEAEKTFSVESLLKDRELAQACYMAHFFALVGKDRTYILHELKDKEYVLWLLNHPEVFEKLSFAKASGKDTLAVLRNIWLKEGKELSGVGLNMALGAALVSSSRDPEACEARYDFYKKSFMEKKLFPQFLTLEPWEFGILFRGRESIEELAWAQDYLADKKKIQAGNAGYACCGLIPYRMKNKQGISVHVGGAFYDHKPVSLQIYVEYGGVCGAVSKGAAGFLRAKGVPAYPIGQPGHCAFIWKHPKGQWLIGNNIGGWNWANGGNKLPWKGPVQIISALCAFWQGPQARESSLMYDLSFYSRNPQHVELLLQEACRANPYNYPAWARYLGIKAGGAGDKKKLEYLIQFSKAMPHEHNLIDYVAGHVLKINPEKVNPYELYACGVSPDSTPEAEELFIRQFWKKLIADCPEVKLHAVYKEGTTGNFLNLWLEKSKNVKWNSKMKSKTSKAFQQALLVLTGKEKTCIKMMKSYRRFLIMWNDEKYMMQAHEFVQDHLKGITSDQVKKEMAGMGRKMGILLKNDKILNMYGQNRESE